MAMPSLRRRGKGGAAAAAARCFFCDGLDLGGVLFGPGRTATRDGLSMPADRASLRWSERTMGWTYERTTNCNITLYNTS